MIDADDPVRLVDEVLAEVDWSDWEAEYNGHRGQPPIHPRYIAGAILYGMYRGIRSSRKLEEACHYRFDFMWLIEGRHIDHTTAETPFGILKAVMGIRQFLLRGLERVKTEWLWAVTAFNLQKLVRIMGILRAEPAK